LFYIMGKRFFASISLYRVRGMHIGYTLACEGGSKPQISSKTCNLMIALERDSYLTSGEDQHDSA
jgi:hypothetical protein